jgi:hypothetical protein
MGIETLAFKPKGGWDHHNSLGTVTGMSEEKLRASLKIAAISLNLRVQVLKNYIN